MTYGRRPGEHRPHYGASAYERKPADAYFTYDERCVADLLKFVDLADVVVHEPAAGAGHMVRELRRGGVRKIVASDLHLYRPCAKGLPKVRRLDYLTLDAAPAGVAATVTNPPNLLSVLFARQALRLMRAVRGIVALLVPYAWDAAPGRREWLNATPLAMRIALSFRPWWSETERIAQPREDWQWLVWNYRHRGPALARYA